MTFLERPMPAAANGPRAHPPWRGPFGARTSLGVTLVELMVSMALGLVLITGVMQVFLSTQQTYRTREAMSRVQENGRIATSLLAHEVRHAGFTGCRRGPVRNHIDVAPGEELLFDSFGIALQDVATPSSINVGQALAIRSMSGGAGSPPLNLRDIRGREVSKTVPFFQFLDDEDNPIETGIPEGAVIVLTSCDGGGADVFVNSDGPDKSTIRKTTGNKPPGTSKWSDHILTSAELHLLFPTSVVYYIDVNPDNGVRGLFRDSIQDAAPIEVVDGVFDMRIEYGVDTTGNGEVDTFMGPAGVATWDAVAAVRIHLLVYSGLGDNIVDNPQTLLFAGANWPAPDRRLYQVFTTTVAARNLLQ